ncbi:MAG: hypothetical protein ACI92E_002471, partial [Oceanicoccus sp.]
STCKLVNTQHLARQPITAAKVDRNAKRALKESFCDIQYLK